MKNIIWDNISKAEQRLLLTRPAQQHDSSIQHSVSDIIQQVRTFGDAALLEYTAKFDRADLCDIAVSDAEFKSASKLVSRDVKHSLTTAIERIKNYQLVCMPKDICVDTQDGIVCQRLIRAIESVGLYVPGGSAPLVSTLLMQAVPAKLAGCNTIVICSPPQADNSIAPELLVAAELCGVTKFYKVGGAQAIAAMAYGTQSVPKVKKIFGPGNAYVTAAKQQVSLDAAGAALDMPAGPSELLIIADRDANPEFVAADLLSQAEHGIDSQVLLISPSGELLRSVERALAQQVVALTRAEIATSALMNSASILVDSLATAMTIADLYAPEHLSLQVKSPEQYVKQLNNVGAIFLGAYTPETMGDYINGANHVLPTYGYADRSSGLAVADFMRYISVQQVTPQGLATLGQAAMCLARVEGLTAHQNAVQVRLQKQGQNT